MSQAERERMVEGQLVARGIADPAVLAAFRAVPRERFVPPARAHLAYGDRALPLSDGQTISQPYMVAKTTELARVRPGARVLDVGTGSGYQAAILAAIGCEVWSIERIAVLAERAAARLDELGYGVRVVVGDGSRGWPEAAPFDAIVCAAAAPELPPSWGAQLAVGGRAVLPIGGRSMQHLTVVERTADGFEHTRHDPCVYVPLVGDEGWSA